MKNFVQGVCMRKLKDVTCMCLRILIAKSRKFQVKEKLIGFLTKLLENNRVPSCLIKDKIKYRRAHVVKLSLQGYKQGEISQKLGCSLSTIEKDVRYIRNQQV